MSHTGYDVLSKDVVASPVEVAYRSAGANALIVLINGLTG